MPDIHEYTAVRTVDLDEATMRIYRADQPPPDEESPPGPLDGKLVLEIRLGDDMPPVTVALEELGIDAAVRGAVAGAATERGLTRRQRP